MLARSYFAKIQSELSSQRQAMAAGSPKSFAQVYLQSICNCPFSRMHLELFDTLAAMVGTRSARLAVAAPRGHAKSTIVSLAFVLWCALFEKEKLILIVSATKEQAALLLCHIKDQLQKNERLLSDFPEICRPEGTPQSSKPWRDNRIRLRNGVMICAYGAGQSLRGARNERHRPGLIIADDLENREHVIVEEQRQKLKEWFQGTLLHAGHPETNVIVVGTILHHDSLLANLVQSSQGPGWGGLRYQAIERFSDHPELWERWAAIYCGHEEFEGKTGEPGAQAYLVVNERQMCEGAQVLWPQWETYRDLMIMREREGRASFQSEKQNEPLDPEQCLFAGQRFHYWEDEYSDEQRLLDALGRQGRFFGACDPSLGKRRGQGDFSAIIILFQDTRTKINYVLAADIKRRAPDETIERIVQYAQKYRFEKFGVEANLFQQLMIDNLQARVRTLGVRLPIHSITSRTNKQARISGLEPEVSQGHLRFCRRHQLLLDQLRQFPVGLHDDGPDALEMAVETARKPVHIVMVRQW